MSIMKLSNMMQAWCNANGAMQIELGWYSGKLNIDFGSDAYAKTLPYEHVTIY